MSSTRWLHFTLFLLLHLHEWKIVTLSSDKAGPRCPGQVGGDSATAFYLSQGTDVHLILDATFPCVGNISAWLCYKPDDATPVFVAVWRPLPASTVGGPLGGSAFRLVGKNHIPLGYVGSHVFRIKRRYQVGVQPGDYIGYHYSLRQANATQHHLAGQAHNQLYSQQFTVGARFTFHPNGKLGHAVHKRDSVAAMLDYGQAPLSVNSRRVCEGEEVELSCGGSELLLVRTARYGVLAGRCAEPEAVMGSTTCFRAVWHVVHARCTGRSRCHFRVNEHVFGDPCPDRSQTLDIEYACVQGSNNRYPVMKETDAGKGHTNSYNTAEETPLQGEQLDRDTDHQLPLPVPFWNERRGLGAPSGGAGSGDNIERSMPEEFTVRNEQTGPIVAGVLVLLALVGGLLAAGIVLYRRRTSKLCRTQSLHNVQSQLIDHHLRLNPTYLDHQSIDALRRACTPGGTMDTLRGRINLMQLEAAAEQAESNAVNYEVVYDNMLVRPPTNPGATHKRTSISSHDTDWGGVDACLAGKWEAEKRKILSAPEFNHSQDQTAVVSTERPVESGLTEASTIMCNAVGEGVASMCLTSRDVPGPPKPPRLPPYALMSSEDASESSSDSDNSDDSSDFSSKPSKFRIWSQPTDDELEQDEDEQVVFRDDEQLTANCSLPPDVTLTHEGRTQV